MTPEQRLDRAEYILVRMAKSGREARTEFRQKINILIDAQIKNEAAWRAESEAINEKINILIRSQMDTREQIKENSEQVKENSEQIRENSEQVKETSEHVKETSEQVKLLAASQAELAKSQKLTDQTLRAFINSLRKRENGKN